MPEMENVFEFLSLEGDGSNAIPPLLGIRLGYVILSLVDAPP